MVKSLTYAEHLFVSVFSRQVSPSGPFSMLLCSRWTLHLCQYFQLWSETVYYSCSHHHLPMALQLFFSGSWA